MKKLKIYQKKPAHPKYYYRYRSAITGRFITRWQAENAAPTSVVELVKPKQ